MIQPDTLIGYSILATQPCERDIAQGLVSRLFWLNKLDAIGS